MKRIGLFSILFVFLGMVCVYWEKDAYVEFSLDYLLKVEPYDVIASIAWQRGKMFLLILLMSCCFLQRYMGWILVAFFSFTGTIYLVFSIMNYGFIGIGVFLGTLFPHGISYAVAVLLILQIADRNFYERAGLEVYLKGVAAALCVVLGCLLESTVGLEIIQWIIK